MTVRKYRHKCQAVGTTTATNPAFLWCWYCRNHRPVREFTWLDQKEHADA